MKVVFYVSEWNSAMRNSVLNCFDTYQEAEDWISYQLKLDLPSHSYVTKYQIEKVFKKKD